MIDIVAAIESVVEAAAALHTRVTPGDGWPRTSLAATALALAVPSGRQPCTAATLLDQLRVNPPAVAQACRCTLGAVLVWRAVDRAELAGEPYLAAAETGVRVALAYLDLAPARQFTMLDAGTGDIGRGAALAVLELQARLALAPGCRAGAEAQPRVGNPAPRPARTNAPASTATSRRRSTA